MKIKSQESRVVEKLLKDGKISNFYAIGNYILRLGARIHDLRKSGWNIEGEFKKKNGRRTKEFEYFLVK